MIVISAACCSETRRTSAGIVVFPAFFEACSRRSPRIKCSVLLSAGRTISAALPHSPDRIRQFLQRFIVLHIPRLKRILVNIRNRQVDDDIPRHSRLSACARIVMRSLLCVRDA